ALSRHSSFLQESAHRKPLRESLEAGRNSHPQKPASNLLNCTTAGELPVVSQCAFIGEPSMSTRKFGFVQLDVFTSRPLEGNQLAVFSDARGLSDDEMQKLARETNL